MQRYVYPGYEINLRVTVCSQILIYSNLKIVLNNTTSEDLPCVLSCYSESFLFLSKATSFFSFKLFPSACGTCPWFPGFIHPWKNNFPCFQGEAGQRARRLLCSRRQIHLPQFLMFPPLPLRDVTCSSE